MVGGGLMVNTLDSQSRSPGSRVGLAGTICCSLMKFWLGGGGEGGKLRLDELLASSTD